MSAPRERVGQRHGAPVRGREGPMPARLPASRVSTTLHNIKKENVGTLERPLLITLEDFFLGISDVIQLTPQQREGPMPARLPASRVYATLHNMEKNIKGHTHTHRQRTTPPTPTHTYTTRKAPQTPKRTAPTNTKQHSKLARHEKNKTWSR